MENTTNTAPARLPLNLAAFELNCDLNKCRTYATEATLRAALVKLAPAATTGDRSLRYMVIRVPNGRWTALFIGDCQGLLGAGFPTIWG